MNIKLSFYPILLLLLCVFVACRTEQAKTEIQLPDNTKVLLLDSSSAAKTIVKDDVEHFFDKITPVDMIIQMGKEYPDSTSRELILEDYKKFIQEDVLNFTQDETDFLALILSEVYELCQKADIKYFPAEIKLIKTHGKHYGYDTYYTRENVIVIPKQALKKKESDVFLKVLLHEISHIVTRLHPTLKTELFASIGFTKIAQPLVITDSLRQRLLTNPDGIELNWVTQLTISNGQKVTAMPLIYANETRYQKGKKEFFNYMDFNFFEVIPSQDSQSYEVLTIGNQQKSTLNTEGINDLFQQKLNTDYIIHPDEIIADNFSIMVFSMKNPKSLERYTEGGKKLIEKIKTVISR